MNGRSETPPRYVRVMTALSWMPLPFGLVVSGINLAGYAHMRARLSEAPARYNFDRDLLGLAVGQFDAFVLGRTLATAGFFLLATFAFAAFGWIVRRRARRLPVAVPLVGGVVIAGYGAGLLLVFTHPVTDYRSLSNKLVDYRVATELANQVGVGVEWAMEATNGWYAPVFAVALALAALCQLAGGILLTRLQAAPRGPGAIAGDGDGYDEHPTTVGAARDTSARRRAVYLITTPLLAIPYAAVNYASIRVAERPENYPPHYVIHDTAELARSITLFDTVALAVVALPWAILGARALVSSPKSLAFLLCGIFTVPYMFSLVLAWSIFNPLGLNQLGDDEIGFGGHVPGWHPPALIAALAVLALWPIIGLVLLARRRSDAETAAP